MGRTKLIALAAIAGLMAVLWYFDIFQLLTLENIKANQQQLTSAYQASPLLVLSLFAALFIVYSSLPIPGLILLTLTGAAIFGFLPALMIASFGSAIGASTAFLVSRYLFGNVIERAFPEKHQALNEGFEKDGAYYLFTIRMVPVFPFFLVNQLMGLTPISLKQFYIATQLGMLASQAIFVSAGMQLGQIDTINSLFSPGLIFSFILMGAFPLIMKKSVHYWQMRSPSKQTDTTLGHE